MAGHDAREEDGLLRMSGPPASRAYNSEDDRGSRATRTDEKPPEAFNRPNLWPYARHSSKPQEPSPPPPINRRRSTRVDDQRRNPPQIVGAPGDNVYRYTPLGAKHFRLVRVLAARSSQVKCEILHRPFGDPPSYIAISYAWGDPSDTTKIMIRDERSLAFVEVHISKSLYHALEALRRKSEDVLVWADALSIDQQNRDEKSEQLLLMTDIYKNAQYVAVWLGPDGDDCDIATALLKDVATAARTGAYPVQVKSMFSSIAQGQSLPALAALFEREYWNRLWIVQEIFNAASIYVYCGSTEPLPWDDYQTASRVFWRYKKDLEDLLPRNHNVVSHKQYSYSQILAYSGPGGLPELDSLIGLGDEALLEVLRMCRRKLSSDPKDKVFGVLGVLGKEVREEFTVDYGKSVKDVYTDVVDFLLTTTDRLDVICEAVHFPVHTSSANLPTWVPDWSHIPATSAIALLPGSGFAASRDAKADYRFLGERRSQLVISAIPLGSISRHGIPVGTLCTLQDYLMAFLNWRALFLNDLGRTPTVQEKFCETICCRQIPPEWKEKGRRAWMEACLHVFASLLQERLPCLAIDSELASYANVDVGLKPEANRRFLQYHFGSRMMGRCFCLTNEGRMGLGTGFMAPNDEVVVPLGCSTPVLLRPEGNRGEYRFIGDVYIDGYMHGEAMDDLDSNKRRLKRYVIH
ncbi:heterokaryon incompatibility protein-domain-containing protein [Diaporthe sp. PMI_573]|nr:heterokaryon incompatibility protein-domain-containing protein [Diaporthaceae sp. PMI_573]